MSSETAARLDLRVAGRVQGVGFRWWARQVAQELGLTGTVRNLADGSVEVRAQGSHSAIEQFRGRLRQGPPAARVESCSELTATPDLPDEFVIVL